MLFQQGRLMQLLALCAVVGVLLCMCVSGARASSTPHHFGLPECDNGTLQQSGYIDIPGVDGTTKHIFYWMFSPRHPTDDGSEPPVVLWLTGGPGCSGGIALALENGPCLMNETKGGGLYHNPYAWNDKAYLLYVDQPVGVGYSYGETKNYVHNESEMAEDMYNFLQGFVKTFHKPDITRHTRFYIVGESYGGHYVPSLATRILRGNSEAASTGMAKINLRAIGIGNGYTDPYTQAASYAEMAYFWCIHLLGEPCITRESYEKMILLLPACENMIAKCNDGPTDKDLSCELANDVCGLYMQYFVDTGLNPYNVRLKKIGDLGYSMNNTEAFFRNQTVMAYLGAQPDIEWKSCSQTVMSDFLHDYMRRFNHTIPPLLEAGLRVMVYAGELDYICNWLGVKTWTRRLIWPGQAEFNAAPDVEFNVSGRPAGTERVYGNFSFIRIYEAGHMVPMDQPEAALYMLNRFLNGQVMQTDYNYA